MSIEIRAFPAKEFRSAGARTGTEGACGYVEEAHSGGPYPSSVLVPEAFAGAVSISAVVLRARLPETLRLAEMRIRRVYGVTTPDNIWDLCRQYIAFVEFCEAKEKWTGKPAVIEITE
jgi:hypothetical protein